MSVTVEQPVEQVVEQARPATRRPGARRLPVPFEGEEYRLLRAAHAWAGVLKQQRVALAERWQMTDIQISGLLWLAGCRDKAPEAEADTMSGFAAALRISLATATGVAERLVRAGLVERASDPDDRRIVALVLTDQGLSRAAEALAEEQRLIHHAARRVTDHVGLAAILEALARDAVS